jgi:hypothetical protein
VHLFGLTYRILGRLEFPPSHCRPSLSLAVVAFWRGNIRGEVGAASATIAKAVMAITSAVKCMMLEVKSSITLADSISHAVLKLLYLALDL